MLLVGAATSLRARPVCGLKTPPTRRPSARLRLKASITSRPAPHAPPLPQGKASYAVRPGDRVGCSVLPPPPLEASPEPLPLDIVYEDEHLIVINKVGLVGGAGFLLGGS